MSSFRSLLFWMRTNPWSAVPLVILIVLEAAIILVLEFFPLRPHREELPALFVVMWVIVAIFLILIARASKDSSYLWARLGFPIKAFPANKAETKKIIPLIDNELLNKSQTFLLWCLEEQYETVVLDRLDELNLASFEAYQPSALDDDYTEWITGYRKKIKLHKKVAHDLKLLTKQNKKRVYEPYERMRRLHEQLSAAAERNVADYTETLNSLESQVWEDNQNEIKKKAATALAHKLSIPESDIPDCEFNAEHAPVFVPAN